MKRIFITGANRGVGLAFVQQLAQAGHKIWAGCRTPAEAADLQQLQQQYPEQIYLVKIDVTNPAEVQQAAELVSQQTNGLDWLINNAGVLARGETLANFDPAVMRHTFDTNTIGPMTVIQAFYPLLKQGSEPLIVNISSQLGSLLAMRPNWGRYSYNASKAALNMLTRMLAFDLAADGIRLLAFHPGWVQTDMGGANADVSADNAVTGMLRTISSLPPEATGRFLTFEGKEHVW